MVRRGSRGFVIARTFGADYSPCGLYRYRLWREWADGGTLLWIMLNPSTADHLGNNDPTIERCERRAVAWGFGRVEVVNLFALRSPDPRALREAADPVGPDNDRAIEDAAGAADMILCGWGTLGAFTGRDRDVRSRLAGRTLFCLSVTQAGHPLHPLYLSYTRQPVHYASGAPAGESANS